ncbi:MULTISPECIES: terminase [unclassified Acinetobacter]|uniref:terminase n=1 Tax=unclassified Acinetobacter TaxID=196816 RepID=UPI002934B6AD|nr:MULTISPECIES: terminase [unclassified Acinetobacter]WOE33101.1 terminase [Acinetobacter sp. SAAs470]WOE39927.1 terminase [Acinetobacter sp. SAAs474]
MTFAELKEKLKDKFWRLNHLYYIKDKHGKKVKFKMTQEQLEYYEGMHSRNVILKARQLGFTTEKCIMQLDTAIFENKQCAMIAHKLSDAQRLFREKVKFAYDCLPQIIKKANPLEKMTTEEIVFSKGGSVSVSTSFRGGTLKSLHVSEFGKICAKFPDKAREIVTGAFEAVPLGGVITLESTAEGRAGYFYDYCQEAEKLSLQGRTLNILEWKFFFFSWWKNQEYSIPVTEKLSDRLKEYFEKLESKYGIKTTPEQQAWYASKEKTLGDDIKREYPSIPEEAFQQSVEGAYYSKQFKELYLKGRIGELPDNSHLPVMTFWDLGVSDSTAIWFVRKIGESYYQVIDYYENSGEGMRHYFKVLKDRGYQYSEHYAPHDIQNRSLMNDGKSRLDIAKEGYEIDGQIYSVKFNVVPNIGIMDGIEQVREILPYCEFDENKCEQGISHLENYRKEWDDKGFWKDKPLHDHTSHGADGFRYFAVAMSKKPQVTKVDIPIFGF